MAIGPSEAQFLRQQAEQLRALARKCADALRRELLDLSRKLEERARQLETQQD